MKPNRGARLRKLTVLELMAMFIVVEFLRYRSLLQFLLRYMVAQSIVLGFALLQHLIEPGVINAERLVVLWVCSFGVASLVILLFWPAQNRHDFTEQT